MDKEEIFIKLKFGLAKEKLIINAPEEYLAILEGVKYDSFPEVSKYGKYDFIQFFASTPNEMAILMNRVARIGNSDCRFFACFPRSHGKIKYEMNKHVVWPMFTMLGIQGDGLKMISKEWSVVKAKYPWKIQRKMMTIAFNVHTNR